MEFGYDRKEELKSFDNTKLGVRGLVDAGVVNIPKMFVRSSDELTEDLDHPRTTHIGLPVIELTGLLTSNRGKIVDQVRRASEEWGFFQVVNHGIPLDLLNNMINAVRKFNEQDIDVKKEFYSRDTNRRVRFNSNHDLFQSERADWRDTFSVSMLRSDHIDPNELPAILRDEAVEFIDQIGKIGDTLFELLSEALGLKPEYLKSIECNKGRTTVCHYYPACPEPDLAMGVTKHTDNTFLTVLVEDETGGLQVLHDNKWVDVRPIPGSLVVNIGDLLQIVSNDKFKSNVHRVLPSRSPRISVIGFFAGRVAPPARLYGPIKELLSEENPPKYKEVLVSEYVARFFNKKLHEKPRLNKTMCSVTVTNKCGFTLDEAVEFIDQIGKIGDTLFELLSEALGLKPEYLKSIECNKGRTTVCHYYPACPEPDLAMGVTKHTDNTFLTVLVEDETGGLQVLHDNKWVDVRPIPGSLVVNIGDLLQIVSNDKFKSNVHRVLPSRSPRISVIGFFAGRVAPPARLYGPIKELLSEENPPKYKEVLVSEYVARFFNKKLHEKPSLDDYRL
ncbi:1-aminocyclopropane-1-carboxylate oxidase homolog 11 [Jatropha curcas]|uniref:1-aminocyclopropane-1-carboxylate oxidase homolog 11 n=1 Tax=Jatropha curcas TaxID=180498 RepID=UPI001894C61D|nr:1-aminocyclopropane-1-carboxylate oxidase homolog 11 [Jatropha curcas]